MDGDGDGDGDTAGAGARRPALLDGRGSRRLSGRETAFWYVVAGVTYIVASIAQKFLLNWIIGPLWLVAVVCIGPAVWDKLRGWQPPPPSTRPAESLAADAPTSGPA